MNPAVWKTHRVRHIVCLPPPAHTRTRSSVPPRSWNLGGTLDGAGPIGTVALLQPAALLEHLPAEQAQRHRIGGTTLLGMVFQAGVLEILHEIGAAGAVAVLLAHWLGDRRAEQQLSVMALP